MPDTAEKPEQQEMEGMPEHPLSTKLGGERPNRSTIEYKKGKLENLPKQFKRGDRLRLSIELRVTAVKLDEDGELIHYTDSYDPILEDADGNVVVTALAPAETVEGEAEAPTESGVPPALPAGEEPVDAEVVEDGDGPNGEGPTGEGPAGPAASDDLDWK